MQRKFARKKRALPTKRLKRRAVGWFMVCVALAVVAIAITISQAGDKTMEIDEQKMIVPEVTPIPPVEDQATPEVWTRYPVPLDDELQRHIEDTCKRYEVPANIVMAVIERESNCDPKCMGDNGNSWGLMQIYSLEHTARIQRLGVWDLLDPYQNVAVGIDYIAELQNYFNGDIEKALSFYNGSGGEPSEYAYHVMTRAEQLLESSQAVTE